MTSRQRLAQIQQERRNAEAELRAEREIRREEELARKARIQLALLNETPADKQEREEFQRKLAIYCNCPEMDPDWRKLPLRSGHIKAHSGGSNS